MTMRTCAAVALSFCLGFAWQLSRAEEITVTAWGRATPPGVSVGAIYLTIRNTGLDDTLLGVSCPLAHAAEVHETRMVSGVMEMREVPQLAIPAHGAVKFSPEGLHLMLLGLAQPLKEGMRVPFTLTFRRAGAVRGEATVIPLGALGPG